MRSITRRNFFEVAGIGLVPVLTGAMVFPDNANAASGASTDSSTARTTPPSLDDLCEWVQNSIGPLLPAARRSFPSHDALKKARASSRFLAKNIQATQIDRFSKNIASQIDPNTTDYSPYFPVDAMTAGAQRYDPNITREDVLTSLRCTSEQAKWAHESLMTNGVSYHFHRLADALQTATKVAQVFEHYHPHASNVADYKTRDHEHLEYLVYSAAKPAHLTNVNTFTNACWNFACHELNNFLLSSLAIAGYKALAGLTVAGACASVEGGALFGELAGGGPEDPIPDIGEGAAAAFCKFALQQYTSTTVLTLVQVQNLALTSVASSFQTVSGKNCSINPIS
jgi:hypothetical protein